MPDRTSANTRISDAQTTCIDTNLACQQAQLTQLNYLVYTRLEASNNLCIINDLASTDARVKACLIILMVAHKFASKTCFRSPIRSPIYISYHIRSQISHLTVLKFAHQFAPSSVRKTRTVIPI